MFKRSACRAILAGIATVSVAGSLVACGSENDAATAASDSSPAPTPTASIVEDGQRVDTAAVDLRDEFVEIVRDIEEEFGGSAGVALYTPDGLVSAGDKGVGHTWSTIKVPIAIEARELGASRELVNLAIKESDNDAAYALWQQVQWKKGDAGAAIANLLAEHDSRARIDSEQFGYSVWPLADQARFAADLQCMDEARYVFGSMGDVTDWQRWGFNKLDRARAKGGWGLDELTGQYTHRQMGVLGLGSGTVGVAISVVFDSHFDAEFYETGVEDHAVETINEFAKRVHRAVNDSYERDEIKIKPVCVRKKAAAKKSSFQTTASTTKRSSAQRTEESSSSSRERTRSSSTSTVKRTRSGEPSTKVATKEATKAPRTSTSREPEEDQD